MSIDPEKFEQLARARLEAGNAASAASRAVATAEKAEKEAWDLFRAASEHLREYVRACQDSFGTIP